MQDAGRIPAAQASCSACGFAAKSPWHNRRVTLMGLGRHGGGVGAARWLVSHGARLTITDLARPDQLAESLAAIADLPIERYRLGEHAEEDFTAAEVVVVNPAVKPNHPLVEMAGRGGAQITSETELFLNACPARVIGVTGSNGKSTTAAMTAAILAADGRRTWLGGNIGRSLLGDLEQMRTDDFVVLEISSFQLCGLSADVRAPHVAIVTNCTPNHLDWHGTHQHYVQSKQRLLTLQSQQDAAVLNLADPEVAGWRTLVRGKVLSPVEEQILPPLRVPGRHNRMNASLAAAAARAIGCSKRAVQQALAGFDGLPHRLQFVAEIEGRRFFNDSKATTPEATMAALASFDAPVWLLAGGYAKGGDYAALAEAIVMRTRGAGLFGAAGPMLRDRLSCSHPELPVCLMDTLDEALAWVWSRSAVGDVILLSPACASFDQYRDFEARGSHYVKLIAERVWSAELH
jgi:UDP-N-acetylmuramoylalanine--D-glutamate ligase